MTNNTGEEFIRGALMGGALGAVLVLLLTPLSGKKLRGRVKAKLRKLHENPLRKGIRKRGQRTKRTRTTKA